MQYDFDKVKDRGATSAMKWEKDVLKSLFGSEDALPVWLADMDLPCAEPIVKAMKKRAAHPIYGYTNRDEAYYDAVIGWMQRRHNYNVKREWVVFTPGLFLQLVLPSTLLAMQEIKL